MLSTLLALAATLQGTATAAPMPSMEPAPTVAPASPLDPAVWTTPGTRIPDLELPRVDGGGLVRLADFEGRRLLLIQFASW